jgi:hypothetical protein
MGWSLSGSGQLRPLPDDWPTQPGACPFVMAREGHRPLAQCCQIMYSTFH